jgi:5'-nucleotidase
MNILLTNDDGIDSEGILKLAEALRSRVKDRIFILAPDADRSGVSHGLSILTSPMRVTEKSKDTWSCTGLPVDCVIAGVMGGGRLFPLPGKPDIIISGINRGANMGNDIIYSGTAAAARQGALMGIPSIAVSLNGKEKYNWDMAVQYTADHLDEFVDMWEEDIFINVNIPNSSGPFGMEANTRPVRKDYHDTLSIKKGPDGNNWCFLDAGEECAEHDEASDWDVVSRNLVSVSSIYIHPVRKRGG